MNGPWYRSAQRHGLPLGAAIFVMALLAVTAGAFFALRAEERTTERDLATRFSQDTANAIERRVEAYVEVLFGLRSQVVASSADDHQLFADYVTSLELDVRFPGAQVVGVAPLVERSALDEYSRGVEARAARAEADFPPFELHPLGDADELLPISLIHPVAGNEAAFGLDLLAIENRADAAIRARNTGAPAATAPTTLVQETDTQFAFLVMVPWYADALTPGTTEERQAQFQGVVYAAFRMGDLTGSVIALDDRTDVEIRDLGPSAAASESTVVFATPGLADEAAVDLDSPQVSVIDVAGRRWSVRAIDGTQGTPLNGTLKWATAAAGLIVTALVLIALRARERATAANRAKSRFLSRMSHELRTPLNAVIGFSQILQLENPETEQAEQASQIEHAGRHLLALIDEVLQISRIEAGEMTMSFETVPVDALIREVVQLLSTQASANGVRLSAHVHSADVSVRSDRQRLSQVLLNLGSNAIKYNRPGGSVEIATEPIGAHGCRILVRDTGPGIAPEDQTKLFLPFERLGAEMTDIEGVGLGLTLTKTLVAEMGAEIGLESTVGVGTTFWVDLEVQASLPPSTPTIETARTATDDREPTGTILSVEDNETNGALVRAAVAHLRHVQLLSTRNGADAAAIAGRESIDLLLLDVNLPDTDGEILLRQLRSMQRPDLPAVILSADANVDTRRRLEAAGADAYLTKPFDVADLLDAIGRHLPAREGAPSGTRVTQGG
ncbi:MAG: CHASE domain-containing protein [Acidimicrobiales bacterium]